MYREHAYTFFPLNCVLVLNQMNVCVSRMAGQIEIVVKIPDLEPLESSLTKRKLGLPFKIRRRHFGEWVELRSAVESK
jgi:hypothetical protein